MKTLPSLMPGLLQKADEEDGEGAITDALSNEVDQKLVAAKTSLMVGAHVFFCRRLLWVGPAPSLRHRPSPCGAS